MKEESPRFYEFMRPIVTFLINSFYTPQYINAEAIPKDGSAIIAGNHKFYFDPLLVDIVTRRTVYSMCAYEYYDKAPQFFKSLGTVRVEPHNPNALAEAISHLKKGHLINIFPEGFMNRTDAVLLPLKSGIAVMSRETGVPIIPFVIVGDYKFHSKNLRIIFGEPLDISHLSIEDGKKVLTDTLVSMLNKYSSQDR